jgi:hypothetical protein
VMDRHVCEDRGGQGRRSIEETTWPQVVEFHSIN